MKFTYPTCTECNKPTEGSNFYGRCFCCFKKSSQQGVVIDSAPLSPLRKHRKIWEFVKNNKLFTLFVSIVCGFFLFATVANAAALAYRWYFENSYAHNVSAAHNVYESCEADHQALVALKQAYNEPINGSDGCNPIPLTPASR